MPLPPASADIATESTRPILEASIAQSLSGHAGSASSDDSLSGPNSLHIANPHGTPSMTDTRQNSDGSSMASMKSSSEM